MSDKDLIAVYVLEEIFSEKVEDLQERSPTKSNCGPRMELHKHKQRVPKIKLDHSSSTTSRHIEAHRRGKTQNCSRFDKSELKENGKDVHECKVCGFKCLRLNDLSRHEKNHAKDEQKNVKLSHLSCEFCDYKNTTFDNLKEHIQRFHPIKLKKSDRKTVSYRRQKHLKGECAKKVFQCESCKYQTWKKGDFSSHMSKHHKAHSKPHRYKCRICGYKNGRKSAIRSHLDKEHPNRELPVKKANDKRKPLEQDKVACSKTENSVKLHSCNYCNCKFIQKSAMVLHVKSHVKGRFDECKLCNYKKVAPT